jgi:hypothetical protein
MCKIWICKYGVLINRAVMFASFLLVTNIYSVGISYNPVVNGCVSIPANSSMVYTSTNFGVSWVPDSLGLNVNEGALDCFGINCALISSDSDSGSSIGLYSRDGGMSWSSSLQSPVASQITNLSCYGSYCAAVGVNTSSADPVIWYSNNGGQNWLLAKLPKAVQYDVLYAVNCLSADDCVAFGNNNNVGNNFVYFKDSTTAGGWVRKDSAASFSPYSVASMYVSSAKVNGVNNYVLVVNFAMDYNYSSFFQLYTISANNLKTWSLVPFSPSNLQWINSIDCKGSVCVAVGSSGGHTTGGIIYSNSAGYTWNVANSPTNIPYPLNGVSCAKVGTRLDCATVGGNSDTHAAALYSTDGGINWQAAQFAPGVSVGVGYLSSVACF